MSGATSYHGGLAAEAQVEARYLAAGKTVKDFAAVSEVALSSVLLAVNPQFEARTVADIVKLAKAKPGELSYGSYGTGTTGHILGEQFKRAAGVDLIHVAYKGGAPLVSDLMGGQVQAGVNVLPEVLQHHVAGKLRILAVSSAKRSQFLPNVPTFAESGIEGLKGFDVGGWYAVYGPKGMTPELQTKLNKAVNAALAQPELKAKYKELGYEEWVGTPQTLSERAAKERQMWSTVTQGIVVD